MRNVDLTSNFSKLSESSPSSSSLRSTVFSLSPSSSALPFQNLDCYRVARAFAALVHRASIADGELRDQATRAAKSAFLNLSEGLPSDRPAIRRRYFAQADGSVHEAAAAVDLAAVIGAVDDATAAELQRLALRLRQMLRGLMRPGGRAG